MASLSVERHTNSTGGPGIGAAGLRFASGGRAKGRGSREPWLAGDDTGLAILSALTRAADDLRGPVASVKVLLELLDACSHRQALERLSPRTRRVRETLSRLNDAISLMLRQAAETGDAFQYRPALVDLGYVVTQAAVLCRPLAESRSVCVTCCSGGPLTMWGDGTLIGQAAGILIEHAVRQARRGARILCELSQTGGKAVISVSDESRISTGCDAQRAFRPFGRSGGEEADICGPSGIRLWLARLIAERHGGCATAVSDEAGGMAVLTMKLPLRLR